MKNGAAPPILLSVSEPMTGTWVDGWFETPIRVKYPEVDPQGVVHHAVYLHYFEQVRTEMLRDLGIPYSEIEKEGTRLMVVESRLRHHSPARYDEVLLVRARTARVTRVRIAIGYRILRRGSLEVLCEGETVLVSVDFTGRPKALPPRLSRTLVD